MEISRVDDGDVAELTHLLVGREGDQVAREREVAGSNGGLGVDLTGHLASFDVPESKNNILSCLKIAHLRRVKSKLNQHISNCPIATCLKRAALASLKVVDLSKTYPSIVCLKSVYRGTNKWLSHPEKDLSM